MSSNRLASEMTLRTTPTLRRQLVVRITLIVTVAAVLMAGLSTFLVARILTDAVDQQITYAVRATDSRPRGPNTKEPDALPTEGPVELRTGGLPTGSITVVSNPSGSAFGSIVLSTGPSVASAEQIATLTHLPDDGIVRTITVEGLGTYRAAAISRGDTLLAVAVPMAATQAVLKDLMWAEAGLIILAAALAALVSTLVVRNSLKRLNQLACTAVTVSNLPLESGEVSIDARVDMTGLSPGSEVGRVGTALNSMLDHVEDSLRAREASEQRVRQFVADASHELRNPLASIRGYAELTRRGRDKLPTDIIFALGRIDSESQRMSKLVEELLLLARLDNGVGLERHPIDLAESVLTAISDTRAASADHHWRLEVPSTPVIVEADAARLQQVLVNVMGNARKHTPAGTTVMVSLAVEGDIAAVRVSDDGPGVEPELIDKLFERFTRGDISRGHDAEGSTGLGLAIAAAVVKEHGGTITATNLSPHGTRFTITLPLAK